MAIRITCPHCATRHRLENPYPVPGSELHCPCGQLLAITYPPGLVEKIRQTGGRFEDEPAPAPVPAWLDERRTPATEMMRGPSEDPEGDDEPPAPRMGGLFDDVSYRKSRSGGGGHGAGDPPDVEMTRQAEAVPDDSEPIEDRGYASAEEGSGPTLSEADKPQQPWWRKILGG